MKRAVSAPQASERCDGRPPRADQEEIWPTLAETLDEAEIESDTSAMRDRDAERRAGLTDLESAVSRRDGQVGALVHLHGRPSCSTT